MANGHSPSLGLEISFVDGRLGRGRMSLHVLPLFPSWSAIPRGVMLIIDAPAVSDCYLFPFVSLQQESNYMISPVIESHQLTQAYICNISMSIVRLGLLYRCTLAVLRDATVRDLASSLQS